MSGTVLRMVFGELELPSLWPLLFPPEQLCSICFTVGILCKGGSAVKRKFEIFCDTVP